MCTLLRLPARRAHSGYTLESIAHGIATYEGDKSSLGPAQHPRLQGLPRGRCQVENLRKGGPVQPETNLLKLLVQGGRAARQAAQVGVKRRPVTGLLQEAKKRPSDDAHPGKNSFQLPHCRQHEPGPAFEHRARPIDMVLESSDMTCTKC